ncbi:MAG: diguanylate cyclase [Desulfotalea sp.]
MSNMYQSNKLKKLISLLFRSRSMAKQLTIGLGLLVCVAECIILGGIYLQTSYQLQDEFDKKVDSQINTIKENLIQHLWALDYEAIENLGSFYLKNDLIDAISIWRNNDIKLFSLEKSENEITDLRRSIDLHYGVIKVGKVTVLFSKKKYLNQLTDMRNTFLITFIVSLLTIAFFTNILLRFVLKHILWEVTKWSNKIVEGDYEYQYDGEVEIELIGIVQQFKNMAATLAEKENNLAYINKELLAKIEEQLKTESLLKEAQNNLEQKIKNRTTDLRAANLELLKLSKIDGLTQIANRRQFDEYLDLEWKKGLRNQEDISLLLCDIDYFKLYNDTFGHQTGDHCLKRVAKVITESLKRPADLAARYGGEEFVVVLPGTSASGALQVATIIKDNLERENIIAPDNLAQKHLTISIGISSCVPQPSCTVGKLISVADKSLYQAKANGKNCIIVSSELMSV